MLLHHSIGSTSAILILVCCVFLQDSVASDQKSAIPLDELRRHYPQATVGEWLPEVLPERDEDRNLDNPDTVDAAMRNRPIRERSYYISCSRTEDAESSHPLLAPSIEAETSDIVIGVNSTTSLIVSAFVNVGSTQYIYGTLVNHRGFTNGERFYYPSYEWDCELYRNWR